MLLIVKSLLDAWTLNKLLNASFINQASIDSAASEGIAVKDEDDDCLPILIVFISCTILREFGCNLVGKLIDLE